MSRDPTLHAGSRTKVQRMIWLIASLLILFTAENIWVAPRLKNRMPHVPTFAPHALSGLWFLALLALTVFSILLIVAQVLVATDRGIPLGKKMGTGFAAFSAVLLCVLWVRVTSGALAPQSQQGSKGHSVTLIWEASKSPAKGYNVYRGTQSGGPYLRINPNLVQELTYQDWNVRSGTTYYYVTRAVDADGRESVNSSEIRAVIP